LRIGRITETSGSDVSIIILLNIISRAIFHCP
jgi:hypothetical protein